jgi:hypothetical protein
MVLVEENEQNYFMQSKPAPLRLKPEGSFLQQGLLQMLADGCKLDNPLSEISEVVVRCLCRVVGLCVLRLTKLRHAAKCLPGSCWIWP